MDTFVIDSPLLIQAIIGGEYCNKTPLKSCAGFVYNSNAEQIGRAFLEFCYSEIFNIRRFPGYETYLATSSHHCKWLVEREEITEKDIDYACGQLKKLYEYTQRRLQEERGSSYRIHRKLSGFELNSLERQISEGQDKLYLPANILSSYSYTDAHCYNVVMARDVDIQDIVMVDYMTSYATDSDCSKIIPLKDAEGEVWVLNKNRFGKLYIKKEWLYEIDGNVVKPLLNEYNFEEAERHLTMDDGQSLLKSHSIKTKPCELDDIITKWVIKRNIEKIKNRGY